MTCCCWCAECGVVTHYDIVFPVEWSTEIPAARGETNKHRQQWRGAKQLLSPKSCKNPLNLTRTTDGFLLNPKCNNFGCWTAWGLPSDDWFQSQAGGDSLVHFKQVPWAGPILYCCVLWAVLCCCGCCGAQTFVLIKRKVLLYSTWFPDKQFIQSIGLRTTGNSHQAGTNRGSVQQQAAPAGGSSPK